MIRKSFLLAAGLLTASLGFSQTPHADPTPHPDPVPHASETPHTLLWRVSGKGLTRPSWLFGTMHVLCENDAALTDTLKAVIAACDEVWFEINLSDMSGMLSSMKYMKMNDSKKLSDLLKPDEYARVKDYFGKHAAMLPFGMLERFKPMLISGLIEEQGLGCQTTDGMELMIMQELHAYKKPVNGLETVAFQAGLFDSIPYEEQAKELVNDIDSADQNRKTTQQLADVYRRQDLDAIEELSNKDDAGMKGYMDLLLYGRNRKWAEILDGLLPGKSLLVAVGAAHLPGKQGVIELLRKKGYTVEPVNNK